MFEYLRRDFVLGKMQYLCRDMYFNKVPVASKSTFLMPKYPVEQLFSNIGLNMNKETHKYQAYCNQKIVLDRVSLTIFFWTTTPHLWI